MTTMNNEDPADPGVPVTGDKLRYGADRDRLGATCEAEFQRLVEN